MNVIEQLRHDNGQLNTRRQFLKSCIAGLGTAWISSLKMDVLAGELASIGHAGNMSQLDKHLAHIAPRAKRVIFLHMAGAPSQLELFDYKPELMRLNGADCPREFLEGQNFAFIQGVPKMLGTQYPLHRADDAEVIDHLLGVGQAIADPLLVVAGLVEGILGAEHFRNALDEGEILAFEEFLRAIGAVQSGEFGFVIEKLELAGSAGHMQEDHAFGFWSEVGQVGIKS